MCCLMGEQGAFTQMAVACQILYLVGLSIDSILFLALVSWLCFALTRLKYAQIRTVVAAHGAGGRSGASEGKFRSAARWEDAAEWAMILGLCWCTGLVPTRDPTLCGPGLTPLALRRENAL